MKNILKFSIYCIPHIKILKLQWYIHSKLSLFLTLKLKLMILCIETWIYRKPTNTNLILNFTAMCPTKWKSGLISCLRNRVKRICSSNSLFDNEVKLLKSVFLSNGYPNCFFGKVLK